jgi:hypothetical protein
MALIRKVDQTPSAFPALALIRRILDKERTLSFTLRHNLAMLQYEPAWTFEHSIECGVSAEFAWIFWTNVSNWTLDTDVESIEIDGPFAAGAQGFTSSKSSGRVEWRVTEVQAGKAVIEFPCQARWADLSGPSKMPTGAPELRSVAHCTVTGPTPSPKPSDRVLRRVSPQACESSARRWNTRLGRVSRQYPASDGIRESRLRSRRKVTDGCPTTGALSDNTFLMPCFRGALRQSGSGRLSEPVTIMRSLRQRLRVNPPSRVSVVPEL